ncbi:hypothetical protein COCNU_contig69417195G000010 [Cocos nucifera]|nr:hypothetical protein [Cocos nucifera]
MSTNMEARKAYAEFEEKVKRTVFLDNLSHKVTPAVIKMALGQFANVVNVEFIPNYTIPYDIPQCALVEMENQEKANGIITEMTNFPFMIGGMPRPVRARPAKAEMFSDRPAPPDRKIEVRWVDPSDPDFEVAKKLKEMVQRHKAETLALVKLQLDEEEKLAKQQSEMLKSNVKKYEMIETIMQDKTASSLARHYGINLADE